MLKSSILLFSLVFNPFTQLYAQSSDLTSIMTDVKHQGLRGTCSVFSATALMESLIKQKFQVDVDLSENYNYWLAKRYSLYNDYLKNMYVDIDGLAGYLAVEAYQYGAMLEAQWPYEKQNWFDLKDPRCDLNVPTMECFTGVVPEGAKTYPLKIETVFVNYEDIPHYLATEKRPVLVNIDWIFRAVDNEGNIQMPRRWDLAGPIGGHVVTIVGYDESTDRYKFQNSWGKEWGKGGYGTMPRQYLIEHFEGKNLQAGYDDMTPEQKDLFDKTSKGVSARLVD